MYTYNGGPQIFNFPISSNHYIPAPSASFKRYFSSAGLTVSELRMQLSGKHLEALNVMHCNKLLLQLTKSSNKLFLNIGGG